MLKTITLPGESLLPVKIVFMRHGKPLLPASGWIAPAGMGAWIRAYDLAEVVREDVPGDGPALARSVSFLVSSSSPRALASARQVGRTPSIVDDIYCEAPLPFAEWRFPRLPPKIWACFFRILWFLGYAHGASPIQAARTRAGKAADRLVSLAEEGPVLLVGHGIMNRLIARELVARGWTAPKRHRNGYWETSAYEFNSGNQNGNT